MEILNMFGLEWKLFLGQVINFLIIAYVLKRFVYKPIRAALDERKRKIDQSLQDAQNAKIALENAGAERKKILEAAQNDANSAISAAKVSAEETKEKLKSEAKKQSEQIISDAKQKAAMEFENLNKSVGQISVNISEKIMSKVFADLFSEEDKQKVLARALDKIEKAGYEKRTN
ncbi:MAG: F0F1 ATP synthase subunit B [Endomicrobium sp.]|jgi:F-type H+-transporting ATPase subunit b|nr:F0F1 ATP synthase subunit B [Endomicrobium sp.]